MIDQLNFGLFSLMFLVWQVLVDVDEDKKMTTVLVLCVDTIPMILLHGVKKKEDGIAFSYNTWY